MAKQRKTSYGIDIRSQIHMPKCAELNTYKLLDLTNINKQNLNTTDIIQNGQMKWRLKWYDAGKWTKEKLLTLFSIIHILTWLNGYI